MPRGSYIGAAIHALCALALWLMALSAASAQPVVEAWVQRYSHEGDASDFGKKIVTDKDGNVIVAGTSDNRISGGDYLIIKYSGTGLPLWTNRYDGPGNRDDQASAVAVNGDGNVIVTGQSASNSTEPYNYDYATVAYSDAGVPLWTNRYNGPGNDQDVANAVAADDSGKVFVTGWSASTNVDTRDYATVAYSGAGVPLWTNRYNGTFRNGDDLAVAMVVGGNGTVFVTGSSWGINIDYDYVTLAYSSAGAQLWVNRYNGGSADLATAMAVDAGGNVFVTGESVVSGSNRDYVTVAYSGDGVPLWTNRYNGPGNGYDSPAAMTADGDGNVFVTGESDGGGFHWDYATVAYSGAGVPLWTNRYPPTSGSSYAAAVAADSSGNVLVTGIADFSYATIKYSGGGVPSWTNRYRMLTNGFAGASAVSVDAMGNVFVTGGATSNGSDNDCVTVAYSGAGLPLWTNRYKGPGNGDDIGTAVAVAGSGNVFVTGGSKASDSASDFATVAYSAASTRLWTNRYNGPANGEDYANAVAVDGTGNVFVTGRSRGAGSSNDYATVAYSGAGVPMWTNRYNGPANNDDNPIAVAVDRTGNVFVTGESRGNSSTYDYDYATLAYSGAGIPLWTNRYSGPVNGEDQATAMVVDASGNVIVTGWSRGSSSSLDYATIKYSGAGVALWTNRYRGPGNDADYARAVAVDANGKVYVTGGSWSLNSLDYATVAYSEAGLPLWTNRYDGPANGNDSAGSIAVDRNGNVFVTGWSPGNGSDYNYATVAYSGAGVPLWTNRYNGPGNLEDLARAVAVDSDGNVFVTGSSYGSGIAYLDYATVAYSSAGVPLWTNRYDGPANGPDQPQSSSCLAIGPDNAVYVIGASNGDYGGTTYDYATIKYILAIRLNYQVVGNQLVLSWSNPAFLLQSAPNAHGDYTDVPGATSPYSTAFSGPQRFFRLRAN